MDARRPIQICLVSLRPTYPCYCPVAPVSEAASSAEAAVEAGGDKIRLLVAYGLALRRGDTRIGPAKASMAAAPTWCGEVRLRARSGAGLGGVRVRIGSGPGQRLWMG